MEAKDPKVHVDVLLDMKGEREELIFHVHFCNHQNNYKR